MARMPRIIVPGQALHMIQRGVNRQAVFFADTDYRLYLEVLEEALERHRCLLHAYVLMTNHVHMLMTPMDEEGPSKVMQSVGRGYVRYVNASYRRTGTLWEGRYKSSLIDSERYLLTCSRYIEMNPVLAQMVDHPRDYKWSSYTVNAEGINSTLITPHDLYIAQGRKKTERAAAYQALFTNQIDGKAISTIRQGTEQGNVIGSERFQKEIEETIKRRVTKQAHGGDRKSERFKGAKKQ